MEDLQKEIEDTQQYGQSKSQKIEDLTKKVEELEQNAQLRSQEIKDWRTHVEQLEKSAQSKSREDEDLKIVVEELKLGNESKSKEIQGLKAEMKNMVQKKHTNKRAQALERTIRELEAQNREKEAQNEHLDTQLEEVIKQYNTLRARSEDPKEMNDDLDAESDIQKSQIEQLEGLLKSIFAEIDEFNARSQDLIHELNLQKIETTEYRQRLQEILPEGKNPYTEEIALKLTAIEIKPLNSSEDALEKQGLNFTCQATLWDKFPYHRVVQTPPEELLAMPKKGVDCLEPGIWSMCVKFFGC
jgi:chromosome segregation ATPase